MKRSQLNRRALVTVAALAALATILSACSSSSKSSSKTTSAGSASATSSATSTATNCSSVPAGPVKIANIVPLSGPTATSGELTSELSQVEADYFNAHDSICGHQVQITNYNDKGDPATSLSIARQLVSQGVTIVNEDSFSAAQNQIQPYLMQQNVLVVNGDGALALFDPKTNPTAFSIGPSNAQYAALMTSWIKSKNLNDVGIISDGTSFSVELAADTEADIKAAGLNFVKTITYSPTALDLTTQLTEAKQSGIKTLIPTGFTGVPAMVSGIKQINWTPTVVGWGGLNAYGITESQLPAGTVDGCSISLDPSATTQPLLTPQNTALLDASKAKIGLNPSTAGILLGYNYLSIVKYAIEHANSLDGQKMKAALESATSIPTNLPGVTLSFSATNHYGLPASQLKECTLKQGDYDILYTAS